MNFEFVRWKKYEKQIQKLEGWINKDKLNFENNYQEITTVGLNVSETNEWLTVAYSLCRDEYLYPIQICKANIIERHSFNTEEVVEQRPLELTKEQEEYVKKDVEVAPSIVEELCIKTLDVIDKNNETRANDLMDVIEEIAQEKYPDVPYWLDTGNRYQCCMEMLAHFRKDL